MTESADNQSQSPDKQQGSVKEIDDVIHGRLRLGVMAYLSTVNPASFAELVDRTGATNGNLSTHLGKLETAGYIVQEKGYKGKRPQTLVHLTDAGRIAWIDYLEAMKQLLG
ncbi:transcriptional regulator [Tenacibaculum sp. KUL152]|nr:transcriptional regulator [Tenacibaculum sp. KUL152]